MINAPSIVTFHDGSATPRYFPDTPHICRGYSEREYDMAIVHLNIHRILYVLRVIGTFTSTWPPDLNVGSNELLIRDLYHYTSMLILAMVWIPVGINIYKNQQDVITMMKNISQLAAATEAILNSVLCRAKKKQWQRLLMNIEEYLKVSKYPERVAIQKYVDRYATFILVVVAVFVLAGSSVAFSPLILPVEFPLEAWYPFSTESLLRKFFIYITHIFIIMYTVSCLGMDILIAVLLFYTTARLELLVDKIQKSTTDADVMSSIRKHQEIIRNMLYKFHDLFICYTFLISFACFFMWANRFISEMQDTIQYVLFKTTLTMALTVICGCFPLLYLRSIVLITQFLTLIIAALQRMYITAWPANDLKEISVALNWAIYNPLWIGKSQRIKSNIFMMLQRSQKPVLIPMGSILPALTLEYYANFLTTVMSYFMTMRAAIAE